MTAVRVQGGRRCLAYERCGFPLFTLCPGEEKRGGLMRDAESTIVELRARVERLEELLLQFGEQKSIKKWYSTHELATVLNRSPYTVREWCREKRISAEKRQSGRGLSCEWMISHDELTRIQNEGLLK